MGFTVKKSDAITIAATCAHCSSERIFKPANTSIFHCMACGEIVQCAYCRRQDSLLFSISDSTATFSCQQCGTRWAPKNATVVSQRRPEVIIPAQNCEDCGGHLLYDNVGNEFCPICIGQVREKNVVQSKHKRKPRRAFQVKCPDCKSQNQPPHRYYCQCQDCGNWFKVEIPDKKLENAQREIPSEQWEKFQEFCRISRRELELFYKFRNQASDVESSLDDLTSYYRQLASIVKIYRDADVEENLEALKTAIHYLRASLHDMFVSNDPIEDEDHLFDRSDDDEDWTEHDRMFNGETYKSNRDRSYLLNSYSEVDIVDAEEDDLLVD